MSQKQYSFSNELRASEGAEMSLEGLAIVFDTPTVLFERDGIQYKEIISRGALDRTDLKDVVLRYNHNGGFVVLARTRNKSLQLDKRSDGLYIQAKLQSDISQHRDSYNAIKAGLIDKMSFGFIVADDGETYDRSTNTRTVTNISKLMDVSIVDQPAYEQTFVEARSKMEQFVETQVYRESVMIRAQLLKVRLK